MLAPTAFVIILFSISPAFWVQVRLALPILHSLKVSPNKTEQTARKTDLFLNISFFFCSHDENVLNYNIHQNNECIN